MKISTIHASIFVLLFMVSGALAQGPGDPVWSLYASGVGQKLEPGMDPCWVTYTVALSTHPRIQANIAMGTMGAIAENITWFEAQALMYKYGRYFDDEADGTYKLSSCEIDIPSGSWSGWGNMKFNVGGNAIAGTYDDTYDKSKPGVIRLSKTMNGWEGTWEETAIGRRGKLYDVVISKNGKTISGKYNVTSDGGKGNMSKDVAFTWSFGK